MAYRKQDTWDGINPRIIASVILLLLTLLLVGPAMDLLGDLGNNDVIVSDDKIKLDLLDTSDASLVGDVLDFVNPDGAGPLYFAPGSCFYTEGFQVKNTGALPIKYRIYISDDVGAERERFREAFELFITTDPTALSSQERLTVFEGHLLPGESSDIFHLAVQMLETAGNEFQGKTYSGIGITVYAVAADEENE